MESNFNFSSSEEFSEDSSFTSLSEDSIDSISNSIELTEKTLHRNGSNLSIIMKIRMKSKFDFKIENNLDFPVECITPFDHFNQIITNELLQDIIKFTYMIANKIIDNEKMKRQNKKKWKNIDMVDLKGVLACYIVMSMMKKNNICDYWTTNRLCRTPGLSELFSRERFTQIKKCFCSNNYEIKKLLIY